MSNAHTNLSLPARKARVRVSAAVTADFSTQRDRFTLSLTTDCKQKMEAIAVTASTLNLI